MDKSKFIYNKFNKLEAKKVLRLCFTIPKKKNEKKKENRNTTNKNVRLVAKKNLMKNHKKPNQPQ